MCPDWCGKVCRDHILITSHSTVQCFKLARGNGLGRVRIAGRAIVRGAVLRFATWGSRHIPPEISIFSIGVVKSDPCSLSRCLQGDPACLAYYRSDDALSATGKLVQKTKTDSRRRQKALSYCIAASSSSPISRGFTRASRAPTTTCLFIAARGLQTVLFHGPGFVELILSVTFCRIR